MILVTAAFMLFSLISFSTVRNVAFCNIQFGSESLKTYYGGSFWLTLATGELLVQTGALLNFSHSATPLLILMHSPNKGTLSLAILTVTGHDSYFESGSFM